MAAIATSRLLLALILLATVLARGGVRANNGSNGGGMLLSAAVFMAARGVECFGHPPSMEVDRRCGEGGQPGSEAGDNRKQDNGIGS